MLVIDAYFELLKFWSTVEYRRFSEMKPGLFLDSSQNCDNALQSILDLGAHIGELSVTALSAARSEQTSQRSFFNYFVCNMYQVTQELLVRFQVPVRLQLPPPFCHESIFSWSAVAFSKVYSQFTYKTFKVL